MRPTLPRAGTRHLLAIVTLALGQIAADATIVRAQWRGELVLAGRAFRGAEGSDHRDGSELDLALSPEFGVEWADASHRLEIRPFARLGLLGGGRTSVDIRDLAWIGVWNAWVVSAGIREVFWGVTESSNPVDILNQRCPTASIEGYEKLGQPMLGVGLAQEWGLVEFSLLPGFRERQFAGRAGSLWSPVAVRDEAAEYASGAGRRHVDWAVRWSHTVGDVDLALVHFAGTGREPELRPRAGDGESEAWIPFYAPTHLTGAEFQWTAGAWLWKAEAVTRTSGGGRYGAGVAGLEYTVADYLSLYAEFTLDTRGRGAMTSFESDAYLGAHLWLPDGEARVGLFVDARSGNRILRAGLRKRVSDRVTAEFGMRWFGGDFRAEPPLAPRQESVFSVALVTHL